MRGRPVAVTVSVASMKTLRFSTVAVFSSQSSASSGSPAPAACACWRDQPLGGLGQHGLRGDADAPGHGADRVGDVGVGRQVGGRAQHRGDPRIVERRRRAEADQRQGEAEVDARRPPVAAEGRADQRVAGGGRRLDPVMGQHGVEDGLG